ncbi:leucine-rich repeat-containing protein kinase family protein [Luteolibacter sp. SL250]|uniref:leucine-rich repeat-containing protein kinase family protein n=1 Tax=Luteolibacter sp. SL250 TaxID=2995170 RepID=UPI002270325F|nr:leucine-rich repeat-containing protein kinase family protein [Luteolibacter sp. SL250]WAC19293.1 leucine-rich repeat-containing protein kinase family protein [Luteolibacter sp. SL250]
MPPDDTLTLLRSGKLHGIHRLDLNAGLETFPEEIFDLADSLEILDLSDNALSKLPQDLPRLEKLRVLFCSGNRFTRLPEILGQCPALEMISFRSNEISEIPAAALGPNLRWIVLTDNRLEALPPEIGTCKRLQKLMLAGNRLSSLPDELAELKGLELLRLSANRFEAFPEVLLEMPRLAWLALGGNPCATVAQDSEVPEIGWDRLHLHGKLGEGASGTIHHADFGQAGSITAEKVAVKLFKGRMTSDGLPESEISATLAAGEHPGLLGGRARITGHPEGLDGLVMPLAGPDFQPLAGPPNLKTCTQDIYPEDRQFPYPVAVKLALGIAEAAAHLHGRRIVHGDLYAHNILWNPQGEGLLGDFGAGWSAPAEHAAALEKIEVRAYGHLLGELVSRIIPERSREAQIEELLALKDHCLCPDAVHRPDFRQIVSFFGFL